MCVVATTTQRSGGRGKQTKVVGDVIKDEGYYEREREGGVCVHVCMVVCMYSCMYVRI